MDLKERRRVPLHGGQRPPIQVVRSLDLVISRDGLTEYLHISLSKLLICKDFQSFAMSMKLVGGLLARSHSLIRTEATLPPPSPFFQPFLDVHFVNPAPVHFSADNI